MSEKPTYEELEQLINELERDKSECRRTEMTLRVFKEALKCSTDAIGMSTPQGLHYYQNEAFDELFGIIGENPPETLYVDKKVGEEVFRIIMSGGQWTGEVQMYAEDGQILEIFLRAYANKDENGNIMSLVGIHTDITERKKADNKIKDSKEIIVKFMNSATDGFILLDSQLNHVEINKTALEITGLERENVIGKNLIDTVPNIEGTDRYAEYKKVMQTGIPFHIHDLISHPLTPDKNIDLKAFKVGDGIGFIFTDITERKRTEGELKYSKIQLGAVLNNIDSIVYIADMESHEILFMNNHMKRLFGKDLTGSICWKSFHQNQEGPCEFCTNDKLIDVEGNATEPYVWEIHNQILGNWYELHDQAIPWSDGRLVRLEIAMDITDRKKDEQKQQNKNKFLEKKIQERTANLNEMNSALTVLLKKRDDDKKNLEEKILSNYKTLISPFLLKLENSLTKEKQQTLMKIVESNLNEFLLPFSQKLSDPMINLTPTEIQIASFIKQGIASKEIARTLNCSPRTIDAHRDSIRKKMNIKNKKINLQSFLTNL